MDFSERLRQARRSLAVEGPSALGKRTAHVMGRGALDWYARRLRPHIPPALKARAPRPNSELRFLSNELFMVTSGDLATSNAVTSGAGGGVQSATWFIPYFDHLAFGGIFTVFRFIEGFARRGVANRVVIYDNPLVDAAKMTLEIRRSFPSLVDSELVVLDAAKKGLEAL